MPPKQAQDMVAALGAAGRHPEILFLPGQGHGLRGEAARSKMFKGIEAFLAKNLTP